MKTKKWFRKCSVVKKDGKYNLEDKSGKLVSEEWFDGFYDYHGIAIIKKDGKYNVLLKSGKLISEEGFDYIDWICDCLIVEKDNKYNLTKKGYDKLIFKEWFDDVRGWFLKDNYWEGDYPYFGHDYYNRLLVKKGGKYNLTKKGYSKLISEEWFDDVKSLETFIREIYEREEFFKEFGEVVDNSLFDWYVVKKDGKYNLVDTNGNGELFIEWLDESEWFDEIKECYITTSDWIAGSGWGAEHVLKVKRNGKYNLLRNNGKMILEKWADKIELYDDPEEYTDAARIENKGKAYLLTKDFELHAIL